MKAWCIQCLRFWQIRPFTCCCVFSSVFCFKSSFSDELISSSFLGWIPKISCNLIAMDQQTSPRLGVSLYSACKMYRTPLKRSFSMSRLMSSLLNSGESTRVDLQDSCLRFKSNDWKYEAAIQRKSTNSSDWFSRGLFSSEGGGKFRRFSP